MSDTSSSINLGKKIRSNVKFSYFYKIIGLGLSYITVPITINYLQDEKYGIWVTLMSLMSWISFFDVGIGNGLRNKVAECISLDDYKSAKKYVSTAYFVISLIAVGVFIIVAPIIYSINTNKIFNTTSVGQNDLRIVTLIFVSFFLINFIISISSQLFYAYHESSLTGVTSLLSGILSLGAIIILSRVVKGNLILLSLTYGSSLLIGNLIVSIYFFYKHREVIPKLSLIDIKCTKDIMSTGIQFFIIQISIMVMYTTDNYIIMYAIGPEAVTPYSLVYKLFQIVTMMHTILLTPFWSGFTTAYVKEDYGWIKKVLMKLNLVLIPVVIGLIVMVFSTNFIMKVWLQKNIDIPFTLPLFMAIYILVFLWSNTYAYFLNGINEIKLQMILLLAGAVINIPASLYFIKYFGSSGVILGTIMSLIPFAIVAPLQTIGILRKLTKKK